MKVLVTTSNQYAFLLEPYSHLFNKHWPGQEIVFLGFDPDSAPDLPSNCTFHSLGKQEDFGLVWTDPLIPFIESLEDEYFIVTVEDMMLMNYVNLERMALLEEEIKHGHADKAVLDTHLNGNAEPYKEGLVCLNQTATYRTTLHPSIWRKKYFQRYLKPGFSAWDFELSNIAESMKDGATIISSDHPENVFEAANIYRKGVPVPRWDCRRPYGCSGPFQMEDMDLILEYIKKRKEQS
jgi:hypothetical protein|tara:strand:+ start:1535 stop:2245 length:711 start_codon:yes stop_codon:yes gene_type:complete